MLALDRPVSDLKVTPGPHHYVLLPRSSVLSLPERTFVLLGVGDGVWPVRRIFEDQTPSGLGLLHSIVEGRRHVVVLFQHRLREALNAELVLCLHLIRAPRLRVSLLS